MRPGFGTRDMIDGGHLLRLLVGLSSASFELKGLSDVIILRRTVFFSAAGSLCPADKLSSQHRQWGPHARLMARSGTILSTACLVSLFG